MPFEIDIIGVKKRGNADAIAMRWKDESTGQFIRGVYDCGSMDHGKQLIDILQKYYFESYEPDFLDFAICSHADRDHVSGMKELMQAFDIGALYMNRPWKYKKELLDYLDDGRRTPHGLSEHLYDNYKALKAVEDQARACRIPIYDVLQGETIENRLIVLSPSSDFYMEQLQMSSKTPDPTGSKKDSARKLVEAVIGMIRSVWEHDDLHEDVSTSPENEMSVVMLAEFDEATVLFTGDAGKEALAQSVDFANGRGMDLRHVRYYQIPHHGGRHNLTPSIMTQLVGPIVSRDAMTGKSAFVSVGEREDYPRRSVVNAFIRRGVDVWKTNGGNLLISRGMPGRDGWNPVNPETFSSKVERWNNNE